MALVGIGFVWSQAKPVVDHQRQKRAATLAAEADSIKNSDAEKGIADLYLARALDGGNHDYSNRLADRLIVAGRPDEAISVLARLPVGESALRIAQIQFDGRDYRVSLKTLTGVDSDSNDPGVFRLEAMNHLELGELDSAIKAGKQAYDLNSGPESSVILGLSYAIASNTTDLNVFMGSVGSPEALQKLKRASSSNTALAQEVYALGLVNSAGRILDGKLTDSQAYVLMAEAKLATKPNQATLKELIGTLGQGIDKDPGNLLLHQLRREVAEKTGDRGVVDHEKQLIEQLQSGRV